MVFKDSVPSKSLITIQTPDNNQIKVNVIDSFGKIITIKKDICTDKNLTININQLASGKYIIHLKSNDNTYIGSIIKQ
jgi:hypothetical protein